MTGRAVADLVLVAWSLGYRVTFGPTPSGSSGRICYAQRRIWVDARTEEWRLLVLCHELGHAIAAARMGFGPGTAAPVEELAALSTGEARAYLCGWALVRRLKLPVTKAEWRSMHDDVVAMEAA